MWLALVLLQELRPRDADRIRADVEAGRYHAVFAAYAKPREGFEGLVRRAYLESTIADFPPGAFERFEFANGGEAAGLLEAGDDASLERLHREFFFTRAGAPGTLRLATLWTDAGRLEEAADALERLLARHPDPALDRALTAARLLHLLRLLDDVERIGRLRRTVSRLGVEGTVIEGREETTLAEILDAVETDPAPRATTDIGFLARRLRGRAEIADLVLAHHEFGIDALPGIPLIVGDALAVASDGADVVAISLRTGDVRWRHVVEAPESPEASIFASGRSKPEIAPACDGDAVYATVGRHRVHARPNEKQEIQFVTRLVCVDRVSGHRRWIGESPYAGGEQWTYGGGTAVAGGRVYNGTTAIHNRVRESAVVCHDARTGALLWKRVICRHRFFPLTGVPMTTLVIDGDRIVACNNDGEIVAMDAATGEVRWRAGYEQAAFERECGTPVVAGGTVAMLPQRRPMAVLLDAATGEALDGGHLALRWSDVRHVAASRSGNLRAWTTARGVLIEPDDPQVQPFWRETRGGDLAGAVFDGADILTFDRGGDVRAFSLPSGETRNYAVTGPHLHAARRSEPFIISQGTALSIRTDRELAIRTLEADVRRRPTDMDAVYALLVLQASSRDEWLLQWYRYEVRDRVSQRDRLRTLR